MASFKKEIDEITMTINKQMIELKEIVTEIKDRK